MLLALTFSAGVVSDRAGLLPDDRAGASSSFTDLPEFQSLQETWDLIHASYVDESAIDDQALIYGAARGMVDTLGDTGHSTFLDPVESRAFEAQSRGEIIGIGVQLDFSSNHPVIVAPIDGSPAKEAGLRRDDVILEIDGISTDGMSVAQVSSALRGDEGSTVRLTIERAGEPQPIEVQLTRARISVAPVSWAMLPDGVALVRLSQFSVGATKALVEALREAKAEGATAVLLDLRDNPGGLVFEAIGVASQFLPEGTTIYQYRERGEEPVDIKTTGIGAATDLPMAILVNGGSASSAEIIASSLQAHDRAELFGESTFGTGTVLAPFAGTSAFLRTSSSRSRPRWQAFNQKPEASPPWQSSEAPATYS
jgi:carboxyl-terminal processing protease